MKERLTLAFSWWAFLHTVALAVAFADWEFGSKTIGPVLEDNYLEIFQFLPEKEAFVFGFSPAIWLVLWIVTGSPRILPWKRS